MMGVRAGGFTAEQESWMLFYRSAYLQTWRYGDRAQADAVAKAYADKATRARPAE